MLTGTPSKNTWITFKHCEDEDEDMDANSDCALEDVLEFEVSQEMLADVCEDIEELVVDTVDAHWCMSVSAQTCSIVSIGSIKHISLDICEI